MILVKCDILVNNETFLVTEFVNLKIKSAKYFKGIHKDMMCIHLFIEMSVHTCMSICVCTIFLKIDSYKTHNFY
jgi:hypothetical protein